MWLEQTDSSPLSTGRGTTTMLEPVIIWGSTATSRAWKGGGRQGMAYGGRQKNPVARYN